MSQEPSGSNPQIQRTLSAYVHIPFCALRCGYCDFNTYTNDFGPGASRTDFDQTLCAEIALAQDYLRQSNDFRELTTVFFGGGTPTQLPARALVRILEQLRQSFGFSHGCEVSVEANPDSVDAQYLDYLAESGFTRVSLGMQSAASQVLATLERTHDPQRIGQVAKWVRQAGLGLSVDLIYGTPGEDLCQWQSSLEAAVALNPDHISCYALTIAPGTKMGQLVRRGLLPLPDSDDQADKYEIADHFLSKQGYRWYEISNWAKAAPTGVDIASDQLPGACRHNLAYWRGQDWWGFGPGAHSHLGNKRWWNHCHPRRFAQEVCAGKLPWEGTECLSETDERLETAMLAIRTSEGLKWSELDPIVASAEQLESLTKDQLISNQWRTNSQIKLTLSGRLLADTVIHRLT